MQQGVLLELVQESDMMEMQTFFSCDPELYGMLYSPEAESRGAILVVHPFAEEKKSSQRILVNICKSLVREGFHVLMFDLGGCGDSEGDMARATVTGWVNDIAGASDFLRKRSGHADISIVGLRLGAYLAAVYSGRDNCLYKMVLIEPVWAAAAYFRKAIRDKQIKELFTGGSVASKRNDLLDTLSEGGTVDFNGYPISGVLYSEMNEYDTREPMEGLLASGLDVSVISVSQNSRGGKDDNRLERYPNVTNDLIVMDPFWTQIEEPDHKSLIGLVNKIFA